MIARGLTSLTSIIDRWIGHGDLCRLGGYMERLAWIVALPYTLFASPALRQCGAWSQPPT
jgi:hypothetical protein